MSRNWGFTPYGREDYLVWKQEGRLVSDGSHAKLFNHKGLTAERDSAKIFAEPAFDKHTPLTARQQA